MPVADRNTHGLRHRRRLIRELRVVATAFAALCLMSGNARALDLKIVTFLQEELTEHLDGLRLSARGDTAPIEGPLSYYYYDDCMAQFGIEGASGEAEFVIDFGQTSPSLAGDGVSAESGLTGTVGERDLTVTALSVGVADMQARGALYYLVDRLARLCRTGH